MFLESRSSLIIRLALMSDILVHQREFVNGVFNIEQIENYSRLVVSQNRIQLALSSPSKIDSFIVSNWAQYSIITPPANSH